MMFDFAALPREKRAKLLLSTVVPRPIAWVTTQDDTGRVNAAAFSFFNVLSSEPPVVGLGIAPRAGAEKHTAANIRAGGGFVVNLVNAELAQAMNITAADFDLGIDELAMAGLGAAPSAHVAPPRIAQAPVALECTVLQITDLPGGAMIVLGQVQALHIDETKMLDVERCWVDTPALDLIGRMHGGGWYAYTRAPAVFEMPRVGPEAVTPPAAREG